MSELISAKCKQFRYCRYSIYVQYLFVQINIYLCDTLNIWKYTRIYILKIVSIKQKNINLLLFFFLRADLCLQYCRRLL